MKGARPLTLGEISLAQTVFGEAIDFASVRIVRRKWWFFQPRGIVMAPTGNIHFHPDSDLYRDDFATAPLWLQGLFIHEMTHVWQAQRHGRYYLPLMRHPFCRYAYRLKEGQRFGLYGLEQQAEVVRHFFLSTRGHAVASSVARSMLPFGPTVTEAQQG